MNPTPLASVLPKAIVRRRAIEGGETAKRKACLRNRDAVVNSTAPQLFCRIN
jgi:hypothetical protein